MRLPGIAVFALALVVLAAGCGSGSKSGNSKTTSTAASSSSASAQGSASGSSAAAGSTRLYALAPTKKCLNAKKGSKAATIKTSAISGSRGNLRVSFGFGAGEIYLAFGKDSAEAQALENRAVALTERHEQIDRKTILAGVRLTHNVFYYSSAGPVTVVLNQKIASCLH